MLSIDAYDNSDECEAARDLEQLVRKWHPTIENDPSCIVYIIPSVMCYGQQVQDMDLVLLYADLLEEPRVTVTLPFESKENSEKDSREQQGGKSDRQKQEQEIPIQSLCLTIEVKSHSRDAVRFRGSKCFVKYLDHWHCASDQSHKQIFSLKEYISKSSGRRNLNLFVEGLLWLRQCRKADLPQQLHNMIGMDSSFEEILITAAKSIGSKSNREAIRTFANKAQVRDVGQILSEKIEPTNVDRKKMEAINKKVLSNEVGYQQKLMKQLLVFRGRGGTGKTIRLLRLASQLYVEQGLRTLVLTYNKALVSDLTRLIGHLRIGDSTGKGGIRVSTIHSFMWDWLHHMHLLDESQDFFEQYEVCKDKFQQILTKLNLPAPFQDVYQEKRDDFWLELLVTKENPENEIAENQIDDYLSPDLNWDLIMIDEAQDWPQNERDILYQIYGSHRMVLADGIDQLIRSQSHTNWLQNVDTKSRQIVTLKKSLRLKTQLCSAVMHFANQIDLGNWELEPVPETAGGKIFVLYGADYSRDLHENLLEDAISLGNKPIDMLFCVPPNSIRPARGCKKCNYVSVVSQEYKNGGRLQCPRCRSNIVTTHRHKVLEEDLISTVTKSSIESQQLRDWGSKVWDGIDERIRGGYPSDVEHIRVVQYESCRGLEGWSTVLFGFDDFWQYKLDSYEKTLEEGLQVGLLDDPATEFANRWLMIPLTRAIDTLVIQVRNKDSKVGEIMTEIRKNHPHDFEWIDG